MTRTPRTGGEKQSGPQGIHPLETMVSSGGRLRPGRRPAGRPRDASTVGGAAARRRGGAAARRNTSTDPRSLGPVSTPIEVPIRDATIRLGQLLKLAGVVDDGAMAREVLERGVVAVNGEVDTRRGRQVRAGDIVTFEDEILHITTTP